MKNLKKHVKILSALSIAASDTRKDTFVSIVIRTLYEVGTCEKKELSEYINEQFGFEPYQSELSETVNFLISEDKVLCTKETLSLSNEEKAAIDSQDIAIRDKEKARFQNFKNFITEELEAKVEGHQIRLLWATFLEYLYNSFFEYGEDALRTLHPHILSGEGRNGYYESILGTTITKLESDELKKLFKKVIERFPDFASSEDIDFLNELAQKTLSFSSLGFEPEIALDAIKHDIVDWVLYLDTNVLYSLLDLHSHPENDSCKALVQLIRDNQDYVKIKLRYSDITYKELGHKKADFELLDDKLTDNSINALLKSDNIDGFSKTFYENLLNNRESTIHPTEAIELSQDTLKRKTIEIGRNSKRIEHLGENYIDKKIQDYFAYITRKNEARLEYCTEKSITFHPIEKSDKQARHDVILRELLLDSRAKIAKGDETSLNSIKYFAVTLDDLLIRFDRSQLRSYNDERSFPVFFKPSFLLNKLVRVLPIKTGDYKKAFIKAVTSKGFHKESTKSRDVLKIVNYLKAQGIDDERVVYNIISQDIFLEKYHKKSQDADFNQGHFIQSELNREFKAFQDQLDSTNNELIRQSENANKKTEETQRLEARKSLLESDVEQYQNALKNLNKRVKQLEKKKPIDNTQAAINFEVGDERLKGERLKEKFRIEIENQIESAKTINFKKWQRAIWWNLFWVLPLLLISIVIVSPVEWIEIESQSDRFKWAGIAIAPILLIFLPLVNLRYWNENNKAKRKENYVVSESLTRKLKELEQD